MSGARVSAEVKAKEIQDYPGGYPAWHAAISAASTRQANARPLSPISKTATTPAKPSRVKLSEHEEQPNQTEIRYRDEFLVPRILTGEIVECVFEGKTFELAYRCTYTPDWYVVRANGVVECHEVKGGHVWEDARIKLKVAARMNPGIIFLLSQFKNNSWKIKIVPR